MRKKAARVCLVIAIVWFILGAFVLGNAPEWFVISAAFAAVAAFLGIRAVRIASVLLVVASMVVAVGEYQARQIMKARVREIREKAPERKSSSLELYPWPNKADAPNPAMTLQLHIESRWRRVSDLRRSTDQLTCRYLPRN